MNRSIVMLCAGMFAAVASCGAAEAWPEVPARYEEPIPVPVPVTPGILGAFRVEENVVDLIEPLPAAVRYERAAAAAAEREGEGGAPRGRQVGSVREVRTEGWPHAQWVRPRKVALADGRVAWTLAVRSPGARALRLRLTNVELGNGTLVVYAPGGDRYVARGPYTGRGPAGRGDFWTASLPGDIAFLEVVGGEEPRLEVVEVGHFDTLDGTNLPGAPDENCHLNVECQDDVPTRARDATGQMNFIKDGVCVVCTGTLLTDDDPATVVPYFLTAYHCISSQSVADTLEVVWLWQTPCGGLPPDYFALPRTQGATLLERSSTSDGNDMAFFRLEQPVPPGVTLAGWTTADPPKDSSATRFPVHHPAGAWKRGGRFHRVDPFIICKPLGRFYAFRCDDGLIEGGSSGSGIFNRDGQIQGQLYGHCCPPHLGGDCNEADCGNRGQWTALYGRFDESWGKVGKWLAGIGGTIHVSATAGAGGDGSESDPFRTLAAAQALSWPGARILMKPGSYPEKLILNKPVPILSEGPSAVVGK